MRLNPEKALAALLAGLLMASGAALAALHPLLAGWAIAGFGLAVITFVRFPRAWWWLLPAALPIASAAPWTGWLMADEFDLLVLAALAAGYLRFAHRPWPWRPHGLAAWLLAGLGISLVLGLLRGLVDAGGASLSPWDDYFSGTNSLRVAKSSLLALLAWPLVWQAAQDDAEGAFRRAATGMTLGIAAVSLAVAIERSLFPGLLEFTEPYRTTAWFWEMHVGGAALDSYLVLAAPFALWTVLNARTPLRWLGAACLALAFAYACLTTFARGVYGGVAVALLVAAFFLLRRRLPRPERALWLVLRDLLATLLLAAVFAALYANGGQTMLAASAGTAFVAALVLRRYTKRNNLLHVNSVALLLALVVEGVAVLYGGSFMMDRLSTSDRDFGHRVDHWQHGVSLLETPADWLLGLGIGRLPAQYSTAGPAGEYSGRASIVGNAGESPFLRLEGPASRPILGGLFQLGQRVFIDPTAPLGTDLRVRSAHSAILDIDICERHLLYVGECRSHSLSVTPTDGEWRTFRIVFSPVAPGDWQTTRPQWLTFSTTTPGTALEIDAIQLVGPHPPLINGDFSDHMTGWLPLAQVYFLPWHIDNAGLELLIERGLFGLIALTAVVLLAWRSLLRADVARHPFVPCLLGAMVAYPALGAVSSLFDVPRVAWLFQLLALFALALPGAVETHKKSATVL